MFSLFHRNRKKVFSHRNSQNIRIFGQACSDAKVCAVGCCTITMTPNMRIINFQASRYDPVFGSAALAAPNKVRNMAQLTPQGALSAASSIHLEQHFQGCLSTLLFKTQIEVGWFERRADTGFVQAVLALKLGRIQ